MKCIYCLDNKNKSPFKHREHIIPECFGKYENNLVLHEVVCDNCNQYFGDNLEIDLGRDSLEGVARYRLGVKPKKTPQKFKRLKFKLEEEGVLEGLNLIPQSPEKSGEGKNEVLPGPQVGFLNPKSNKYDFYNVEEIPNKDELLKSGYELKEKDIVIIPAGKEFEYFKRILTEKGMETKILRIEKQPPIQGKRVPVKVTVRIDRKSYRGFSKIIFNYLAFNMGRKFVIKDDFDKIRKFIRFDKGNADDFFKVDTKPILYEDYKLGRRIGKGHIICLGWDKNRIIGRLSLYNAIVGLTYITCLCKNYKGFWLPLDYGHYFNPTTKKVGKLVNIRMLILP